MCLVHVLRPQLLLKRSGAGALKGTAMAQNLPGRPKATVEDPAAKPTRTPGAQTFRQDALERSAPAFGNPTRSGELPRFNVAGLRRKPEPRLDVPPRERAAAAAAGGDGRHADAAGGDGRRRSRSRNRRRIHHGRCWSLSSERDTRHAECIQQNCAVCWQGVPKRPASRSDPDPTVSRNPFATAPLPSPTAARAVTAPAGNVCASASSTMPAPTAAPAVTAPPTTEPENVSAVALPAAAFVLPPHEQSHDFGKYRYAVRIRGRFVCPGYAAPMGLGGGAKLPRRFRASDGMLEIDDMNCPIGADYAGVKLESGPGDDRGPCWVNVWTLYNKQGWANGVAFADLFRQLRSGRPREWRHLWPCPSSWNSWHGEPSWHTGPYGNSRHSGPSSWHSDPYSGPSSWHSGPSSWHSDPYGDGTWHPSYGGPSSWHSEPAGRDSAR